MHIAIGIKFGCMTWPIYPGPNIPYLQMPYVPRFWLVEIRQMESASNKAGQLWRMCCTLHKSFHCNGSSTGAQKRAMGWGWWWKHIHPRRSPKIEMRLVLRVAYSNATNIFYIINVSKQWRLAVLFTASMVRASAIFSSGKTLKVDSKVIFLLALCQEFCN